MPPPPSPGPVSPAQGWRRSAFSGSLGVRRGVPTFHILPEAHDFPHLTRKGLPHFPLFLLGPLATAGSAQGAGRMEEACPEPHPEVRAVCLNLLCGRRDLDGRRLPLLHPRVNSNGHLNRSLVELGLEGVIGGGEVGEMPAWCSYMAAGA